MNPSTDRHICIDLPDMRFVIPWAVTQANPETLPAQGIAKLTHICGQVGHIVLGSALIRVFSKFRSVLVAELSRDWTQSTSCYVVVWSIRYHVSGEGRQLCKNSGCSLDVGRWSRVPCATSGHG